MDGLSIVFRAQRAAGGLEALAQQQCPEGLLVQRIVSELFRVDRDGYLLALLAIDGHRADAFNRAQTVAEVVHVLAQFPIGLLVTLHRDKQR